MGTLERYQKKGGFVQLLSLIEGSEPEKTKKFLAIIKQESPAWEQALIEKALNMERLATLGERPLSESLEGIPPNVLAAGLAKEEEGIKKAIITALNPVLQKKIENALRDEPNPSPGNILACQLRMIASVRGAINDGRIKQNQLPESLQISEKIESELAGATWTHTLHNAEVTPVVPEGKTAEATSTAQNTQDEAAMLELKRKMHLLYEENQQLKSQVIEFQHKLSQIKKIVD